MIKDICLKTDLKSTRMRYKAVSDLEQGYFTSVAGSVHLQTSSNCIRIDMLTQIQIATVSLLPPTLHEWNQNILILVPPSCSADVIWSQSVIRDQEVRPQFPPYTRLTQSWRFRPFLGKKKRQCERNNINWQKSSFTNIWLWVYSLSHLLTWRQQVFWALLQTATQMLPVWCFWDVLTGAVLVFQETLQCCGLLQWWKTPGHWWGKSWDPWEVDAEVRNVTMHCEPVENWFK